jgi:hypothetical protein
MKQALTFGLIMIVIFCCIGCYRKVKSPSAPGLFGLLPNGQETDVSFHFIYKKPEWISSEDERTIVKMLRRIDYRDKRIMEIQQTISDENRKIRVQLNGAFVFLEEEKLGQWVIISFSVFKP